MSYFSDVYRHHKNKIKVKLGVSNDAAKSELKGMADIHISGFA